MTRLKAVVQYTKQRDGARRGGVDRASVSVQKFNISLPCCWRCVCSTGLMCPLGLAVSCSIIPRRPARSAACSVCLQASPPQCDSNCFRSTTAIALWRLAVINIHTPLIFIRQISADTLHNAYILLKVILILLYKKCSSNKC